MSRERADAPAARAVATGLERLVRDLDAAPLSLDDVRGRARQVRARRRAAAVGGVVAAAAVLVPLAVVAGADPARTGPPPVATDGPRPTRADDDRAPDEEPTPTLLTGAGVALVQGRTLVRADGSVLALPAAYEQVVVLGDGLAGLRDVAGGRSAVGVVDARGRPLLESLVRPGLATDETARTAAWVAQGELVVAGPDGRSQVLGAVGRSARPVSVVGRCRPVAAGGESTARPDPAPCAVYVDSGTGEPGGVSLVDRDGTAAPVGSPAVTRLGDAGQDGLLAVTVDDGAGGPGTPPCGEVQDAAGTTLARTCDAVLGRFSPDGRLVVGTPSDSDGLGPLSVSLLRTVDLAEVARLEPSDGFVGQVAWAGDDRLAVTTYDGEAWRLSLLDADGTVVEVGRTDRGDEVTPGIVLATGS